MCAEDDDQPLEIESIDRRNFVKSLAGTAALGMVGFPAFAKPQPIIKAIKLGDLQIIAQPNTSVSLRLGGEDVLLVRDAQNKVRAFNPTCTHKKCKVRFNPMRERLDCKCHKSSFNLDGEVQGGPAPRDLETFATRIDETKQQLLIKLPSRQTK
ncbi:MAG: Rieske 2Fe-2S domain-containing protein [Myxococcota bacterium]|nr:Rieske 2Fe-2S domain-containing protein [Myxococcota bacterium]